MEVLVAVIGALALIAVESWRRRGEGRRLGEAGAAERGQAYEAFVGDALNALSGLQRLVALAPRIGLLPLSAPAWEAARDARDAQEKVTKSHAPLRRLAPDGVAVAADALLEALRQGTALTSARQRDAGSWDKVWEETRAARIEFKRLAGIDAAAPTAVVGHRRRSEPTPRVGVRDHFGSHPARSGCSPHMTRWPVESSGRVVGDADDGPGPMTDYFDDEVDVDVTDGRFARITHTTDSPRPCTSSTSTGVRATRPSTISA